MTDTYSWDDLLKTADEAGFSVLDPGEYDVRVKTAEATRSKADKDMIKVNFEVISGPSKGRGGIFNYFVLSPENPTAVGFFFRNMATLGLDRNYFASRPTMAKLATDMVGRTARIKIKHEEFNGQTQMRVDNIKKIPGDAATPVPAPVASPQPQPTVAPQPAPVATPHPAPAPASVPTPTPEAAPVQPAAPVPVPEVAAPATDRPAPPASPF